MRGPDGLLAIGLVLSAMWMPISGHAQSKSFQKCASKVLEVGGVTSAPTTNVWACTTNNDDVMESLGYLCSSSSRLSAEFSSYLIHKERYESTLQAFANIRETQWQAQFALEVDGTYADWSLLGHRTEVDAHAARVTTALSRCSN